ncbi:hypothetical protein [Phyllobacterium myrsinacearum]|uniref:Uncharacterized protein n=1 Tax=Phyllobacterium myrsinacearum TaxID=28101 RepID=A0A839ELU7_9HYPH|nr:hypothetical protein [Phyllobacterium myrsinacearum]MBA8881011.1 hypothetical protein [Phyllobacterium myrsinacearum]
MTKIVIYGGTGSGKYVLALQMQQDNPTLSDPVIIKSPSDLRPFLSSPHTRIGIVNALSVDHIISKSRMMELGPVLFVPAPAEVEAWGEDLSTDAAAWDWLMGLDVTDSDISDQEASQAAIPEEVPAH